MIIAVPFFMEIALRTTSYCAWNTTHLRCIGTHDLGGYAFQMEEFWLAPVLHNHRWTLYHALPQRVACEEGFITTYKCLKDAHFSIGQIPAHPAHPDHALLAMQRSLGDRSDSSDLQTAARLHMHTLGWKEAYLMAFDRTMVQLTSVCGMHTHTLYPRSEALLENGCLFDENARPCDRVRLHLDDTLHARVALMESLRFRPHHWMKAAGLV